MTGGKHNYASVMIRSLKDFKAIERAFDSEWFFRGQRCSSWDLETSLERSDSDLERADYAAFEKHALTEARRLLGWDSGGGDDFSCLAFLQHHGCKTRLLDFTLSLEIALYFATQSGSPENDGNSLHHGAIWAISKLALGKKIERLRGSSHSDFWNTSRDLIQASIQAGVDAGVEDELAVVFCQPEVPNPRIIAQKGLFLAPLNLRKDFKTNLTIGLNLTGTKEPVRRLNSAQELVQAVREEEVFKLIVVGEAVSEFRAYLETNGINEAVLLPDLEKFAKNLNQWRPRRENTP